MLPLFPQPRHLENTGGSVAADSPVEHRHDPQQPAQGYTLSVESSGIVLRSRDAAGDRYGRATLAQLRGRNGATLPCTQIRDWPDFPVRGYMLDVSRDRVPTRETLARIVDLLDLCRINHLQLYTEHTFAYTGHETVWRNASPITADDIRWLDGLCSERNIELAANQNAFGHMGRWLAHDAYKPLAEAPDGWTTSWGARWKPGVLAPTDESLALVQGLFTELLPLFSSNRVNINCDETFELGKGRSEALVAERGRGKIYIDFVLRIIEDLHRQGKEVLFWGDVVRQHPDLVEDLPKRNTTALLWSYEAPQENPTIPKELESFLEEVGIDEDFLRGFAGQVEAFRDVPFWVCPGTSTWNSLLGRPVNSRANLLDAAEAGLAHGAGGYLITDWGDNGHMQPPSASFAPLAEGAVLAWCTESNRSIDLAACVDHYVFADATGQLTRGILQAANAYRRTGANEFNGSPLFYALLKQGGMFGGDGKPTSDGIQAALDELDAAGELVEQSQPRCTDGETIRREILQAIRLTRLGAERLAHRHELATIDGDRWAAALDDAITEQRACWNLRSRPGGLDDSIGKIVSKL